MVELKKRSFASILCAIRAICHFWVANRIFFICSEKASHICVKELFLQSSLYGKGMIEIGSYSFDDSNSFGWNGTKPGLY